MRRYNYFELYDDEGSYGIVKAPLDEKEFKRLVEEYKKEDEYYDNIGLVDFLREKGIEVELLDIIPVYF